MIYNRAEHLKLIKIKPEQRSNAEQLRLLQLQEEGRKIMNRRKMASVAAAMRLPWTAPSQPAERS